MRLPGPSPQAEPIRNRGQKRDSKGETQEYRTVGQQNRRSVVFIAWSNVWHESSTALTLREIAPNRQAQASALLIVNNCQAATLSSAACRFAYAAFLVRGSAQACYQLGDDGISKLRV
jgi:hypothetical protein